jgi:integrase
MHAFVKRLALRLGIALNAREDKTVMERELREPKDLGAAIGEYVQMVRISGKRRSKHFQTAGSYLRMLQREEFGCLTTEHLNLALFKKAQEYYANRYPALAKFWRFVRCFSEWCDGEKYYVPREIIEKRLRIPDSHPYYTPTFDEVKLIFDTLTRPIPEHLRGVVKRKGPLFKEKMSAVTIKRRYPSLLPVFWLGLFWCVRPGEASQLQVKHWNPRNQELEIPAPIDKTDARSFRVDDLTAQLLNHCVKGRRDDDLLFTNEAGTEFRTEYQNRILKRNVLKPLRIRGSNYSAKHFACTRLCVVLKGRLRQVMKVTGHTQVSQLQRYLGEAEDLDLEEEKWMIRFYASAFRKFLPQDLPPVRFEDLGIHTDFLNTFFSRPYIPVLPEKPEAARIIAFDAARHARPRQDAL